MNTFQNLAAANTITRPMPRSFKPNTGNFYIPGKGTGTLYSFMDGDH